MTKALVFAAALFATPAFAQTTTIITPDTTGSITFTPSQETEFRQVIMRNPAPVVTVKERVIVGATLPAEVELAPVPTEIVTEVPAVRSYRYVRTDAGIALVQPETRRVVRIIESR
jgi:hypothetical protein